ncbi:MAG TPA: choice-of-anchor L domain-containing protein [Bacteroidales bacterium]|nr:choice-of-anchor L domain-containing protein [Bacteroidales bacterium]HSA43355.1 choice-of-anchor L domain-containing protein [Bacteroidales bacterium]
MKRNITISGLLLIAAILSAGVVHSQLLVSNAMTPQQWVQDVLIGQGIQVTNVTYNGATMAAGTFTGSTNIGIASGVIMTSGDINVAPGPNNAGGAGLNNNWGGDPDLAALAGGSIYNACVLEFDFIPQSDTVKFRYAFGSDEYHEFANSSYNDVFGFFLSGPGITGPFTNGAINIARLPGTNIPVSINNINNGTANAGPCINCAYLINNPQGANTTIQYDAFTVVLEAKNWVTPCVTYHIKLAISDVGDGILDSGVFLEENSFTSNSVSVNLNYVSPSNPNLAAPVAIEGCRRAELTFTLPYARPDSTMIEIDSIYGSATNGVDYNFVDTIVWVKPYHISSKITVDPVYDGISEGTEEIRFRIKTSICEGDTILIIPILDYFNIQLDVANDTIVCEGEVPLWVNPNGGFPPYLYQWSPIGSLSNPYISNPLASPEQTTMYRVEVRDSTRCSLARDSILVTYHLNPLISFKPSVYEGCDPLEVQFTNNTTPDAATTYLWEFTDGTSATDRDPVHVFTYDPNIPTYGVRLTATTAAGCSKQYAIYNLITVHPMPVAGFVALPDSTTVDEPLITFSNQSQLATYYLWTFGDSLGGTSNEMNPTYVYQGDGLFTVWLYTWTEHGCRDSISSKVLVIKEVDYDLTIPNIITPNGDGKNDKFVIENLENYMVNVLSVYNRWGKKVFEQSPYLSEWDGANLPDGTYYVVLRYKKKRDEFKYDGTLTILR